MGANNNLHQVLRSLCFNTHWNYAIFWKLKHRAPMILTWEDAYYDTPHDYHCSEIKHCRTSLEQNDGGKFSHDPLGLAVAKMPYHVYSLGEGIVGQVAVTGKHRWICADNELTGFGSSFEFADGWQSQFFAGVRTIVVVAVVPLGVVQLGSLNKVTEDLGIVTHIREIFLYNQDYIIDHVPSQMQNSLQSSSSLHDVWDRYLSSDIMPACFHDTEKIMTSETLDVLLPIQCSGNNYSPHSAKEFYSDESSILLQECGEMRSMRGRKYEDGSSGCKDMKLELDKNTTPILHNDRFNDSITIDSASFLSVSLDAAVCETDKLYYMDINQKEMQDFTRPSDANFQKVAEKSKSQTHPCYKNNSYFESKTDMLKFPAGCELHEALGPGFLKGREAQVNQDTKPMDMPEPDDINSSQMTYECGPEHLLEAMVANFCNPNGVTSSGICGVPAKNSKRRGRVGESRRPRPRDRQLIQDRIKELRELVPSGAKCSIDSLLERAIKHMLFLQSITKHADTKTTLQHMKIDALGSSSYEQGSSWVMEVGGHLKVHSILVENLSKNGQMLVEMLCEESSHFLEIAEAIRSLELTILKGSTRIHGDKIWINFVVEGQHNRNVHRLDILWPLVQILQSKTSVYSK